MGKKPLRTTARANNKLDPRKLGVDAGIRTQAKLTEENSLITAPPLTPINGFTSV